MRLSLTWNRLIVVAWATVLAGCLHNGDPRTDGYGAQPRQVRLETDPPGVNVYVVPDTVWFNQSKKLLEDRTRLDQYSRGPSPVTASLPPYRHVLLAFDSAGQPHSIFFVPTRNMKQTLMVAGPPAVPNTPGIGEHASGGAVR